MLDYMTADKTDKYTYWLKQMQIGDEKVCEQQKGMVT